MTLALRANVTNKWSLQLLGRYANREPNSVVDVVVSCYISGGSRVSAVLSGFPTYIYIYISILYIYRYSRIYYSLIVSCKLSKTFV